jgi:hypothetical protein
MSDESKPGKNNGQSAFEKNLMSDVVNEYLANNKMKVSFDLKKIRKMHADRGYGIRAWDEKELQDHVDALVKKGLIDDLHNGEYQISEKGIKWKDDGFSPF